MFIKNIVVQNMKFIGITIIKRMCEFLSLVIEKNEK